MYAYSMFMLELGYAGWLKGRGRGGRLNNTSAAAHRVSSNFSSRFFFSKQKRFTRAYQHIVLQIYYLHCVSKFYSELRFARALRGFSLSLLFLSIFLFLLSLTIFSSLSLSQSRLDLSNLTFMHAHTTHNIV